MADLIERLIGQHVTAQPKIPVHSFVGCMAEYARGKITVQSIIDFYQLTATEQTEAGNLYNAIVNGNSAISTGTTSADQVRRSMIVHDVLGIAELGAGAAANPYPTAASVRTRFGI
jgi:hypothetical protein